jgi:gluconate 2-dehydrogenase gamma chain
MISASRRALLKFVGVGAAAPIAARGATQSPTGSAPPSDTPGARWAFFTDSEAAFITAAVDRLLPADAYPSASQAGVVVYIDRQLAGDFGRGARMYLQGPMARGTPQQGYQLGLPPAQVYRRALAELAGALQGQPFEQRDAQAQDAFLKRLEAGELMLGDIPSAVFFETLLANTIEGYFADPMYGGNRGMVGWRMVGFPGAYAMFVQWVDRHGIRFDRPPMSIGHGAAHGHGHGHGK